ncbi:MAG: RDD family protein [Reichenbachiella sp.]|uniref:RDD family protein n=1 Tax=Reichenbachiella sp. TaxID=2184521 RepID=UPI00329A2621
MAIYINTNQNVQIQYEISSIADRLLAYLIDVLVIAGISIGVIFLGMAIEDEIIVLLLFAVIFFYHLICELFMNGQSVGKRSRGIRVMKRDGNSASFSSYFLRFLLRPIDSLYGLGLAIIFFTDHNQRLGDLAAGTVVVNLNSEDELKRQINEEMNINPHEGIKYMEVNQLTEEEVNIIRTILRNRAEDKKHHVVQELAQKVSKKINVDYDKDWAYYFLQRLIQDYHKTHTQV